MNRGVVGVGLGSGRAETGYEKVAGEASSCVVKGGGCKEVVGIGGGVKRGLLVRCSWRVMWGCGGVSAVLITPGVARVEGSGLGGAVLAARRGGEKGGGEAWCIGIECVVWLRGGLLADR